MIEPREILGVGPEASLDDLRRAFRAAAMRHHPDRNGGCPQAAARFMAAREAYEALVDELEGPLDLVAVLAGLWAGGGA